MPLGLYISVPFCPVKCSYCNFASDVFSRSVFAGYIDRVCADLGNARRMSELAGAGFDPVVDSIYFGGGTPTLLDIAQLERIFVTISQNFEVRPRAEITVECAPGTLAPPMVDALARWRVNRVSLGVQSFVDREAASVGRRHDRATVLQDISRLRAAGIENLNIDLIAGLPYQSAESWAVSLTEAIATGTPHVSVYMMEVDEDSRLGRELVAGGTKYHAHFVPDEDLVADLYESARATLESAGIHQYEISNFGCAGFESRHNLKYWTRQAYLGFGVDAHSMLLSADGGVRFAWPESLQEYLATRQVTPISVTKRSALEETFFLGLRLNKGVDLREAESQFGRDAVDEYLGVIGDLQTTGLLEGDGDAIRLTKRGRLLSNEVFQQFISVPVKTG